ncbi:hypothetical protein [Vibrio parahaemolyticus]|uniref:hypothetical protein n=1 Tax=Vibrio parahaemolyticus TaxID=670 RepID=UPI0008130CC5|nr:hypothetical protein [Vibrio parahaemolyticus]OCP68399.1 hypothetical protein AKH08_16440 [Vibrio parahaemolyticus]
MAIGKLKSVARSIANIFAGDSKSVSDYIDLEMNRVGHPTALQCSSGALVTLIKINGLGRVSGESEIVNANKAIATLFRKYYTRNKGPVLAWMYAQSTETISKELEHGLEPTKRTAHRVFMDADAITSDIVDANTGLCHSEENIIAIWTLPQYMKGIQKGKEVTKKSPEDDLSAFFRNALGDEVNPLTTNELTVKQHRTDVETLVDSLVDGGILHTKMEYRDAAQWMKYKLNDGGVSRHSAIEFHEPNLNKAPRFRGSQIAFDLALGRAAGVPKFMERLSEQLPEDTMMPDDEGVEGILLGRDRYHACFTVDVCPNTVNRFNRFLKNIRGIDMRMTFMISPMDAGGYAGWNHSLNSFFRANDECKKAYDQYQFNNFMRVEHNAPECNLQILIVISAKDRETLIIHRNQLDEAMTDWGNAQIRLDNDDPMQTFVSSIPGLNYRSFSRGCWISSMRLARLIPNQRPATFWDQGLITFRTEDGVPFYYQPNSSLQSYSTSLFIAPPRQGKSVLMNVTNLANILAEGVKDLGLMLVLDIGPTSKGVIQLIRYMLIQYFVKNGKEKSPEQIRKYTELVNQKVVEHKWDPDTQNWNINPLETRIGFNEPTKQELEFMTNFYVTICSQPETGMPKEGTSKLLESLITEVFDNANDRRSMRMFEPSMDPNLAQFARKIFHSNPNVLSDVSIFELRDMFFQQGQHKAALRAHRLAMPTVNTLVQCLSNSADIKEEHDPTLIQYIKGMLNSHIQKMPHLAKASTIDFQAANIIAFDMKPVAKSKSNQGKLETFAQYLLAMQLGMRKFTLDENVYTSCQPLYKKYWKNEVAKYGHLPKCLAWDEWHALSVKETHDGKEYSKSQAGAEYVDFLIREAPKWDLSVSLASHRVADFTETMIGMSTNRFFFSGLEEEEIEVIRTKIGLTDSEVQALKDGLQSPKKGVGNEIFYQFKANNVSGSDKGVFSAKVKYLCSGLLMWALSTDKKDMPHKIRLAREHGDKDWLSALYRAFPDGSMAGIRQEILKEMRESLESDEKVEGRASDVEEYLYEKVLKELGADPEIKKIVQEILS